MLCHSCSPIRSRTGFAGMTEETGGLDKPSPYNTLLISGRHKVYLLLVA